MEVLPQQSLTSLFTCSDFVLLFFSGLGLIVVLFVSVKLLYNVGNVELPGTLAAVSGAGASSKRD